jgi:hypothetical protein
MRKAPSQLRRWETCSICRRSTGRCWRSWPAAARCCPAGTCSSSSTSIRTRNAPTGTRSRELRSSIRRSRARACWSGPERTGCQHLHAAGCPVITDTRLRGGNAASARGAATMIGEGVSTARAPGGERTERPVARPARRCTLASREPPAGRIWIRQWNRPGGPQGVGDSRLLLSQLHSSICFATSDGADGRTGEGPTEAPTSVLGLPQIFSPAEAALILRTLGLAEITECALRARAYRRRVPCHVNGRRITFTLSDLHEIAEGQPRRPPPPAEPIAPALTARPIMRRDTSPAPSSPTHWRARGSRQTHTTREPA